MLPTPAAAHAIAVHRFEQSLQRALACGEDCPEILLRPTLETLFQIVDLPRAPRRLRKAALAAIDRIVARLSAEREREVCRWFAAIRTGNLEIPGLPVCTVN